MRSFLYVSILLVVSFTVTTHADETDQFMTWGTELEDSAPALNEFVNATIQRVLAEANAELTGDVGCVEVTERIFREVYLDRLRAGLTDFCESSDAVDLYPPDGPESGDMRAHSIYRGVPFYALIKVARTVRVGEVYLGLDKLAHLFGMGRRYYLRYLGHRQDGMLPLDAEASAVMWGVLSENTILGRSTNGIFSLGDLEANYRGLLLARDFCEGNEPYLMYDGGRWTQVRPVDLRDYVCPSMDESFMPPLYEEGVVDVIEPVLREECAHRAGLKSVTERMQHYRDAYRPSRSMTLVTDYLRDKNVATYHSRILEALGLDAEHSAAPLSGLSPVTRTEPE